MLPIWSENSGSLVSWSCLEICSIHATQYLVYSVSACLVGRKDFKIVGLLIYYYNIPFDGVKRRFGSLSSTLITDKNIDWLNWIWKRMLIGYEFSIFCRSLTTTCLFRMINYSPRRGSGFVKLTSFKNLDGCMTPPLIFSQRMRGALSRKIHNHKSRKQVWLAGGPSKLWWLINPLLR